MKGSRKVTSRWVQALINTSLQELMSLGPFKKDLVLPPQKVIIRFHLPEIFHPVSHLFFLEKVLEKNGWQTLCTTCGTPGDTIPALRAFVVHQLHLFLNRESLHSVTNTVVISHLDYCNLIYMELPLKNIQKLQLVQNIAMIQPKMAHVTSLLQ